MSDGSMDAISDAPARRIIALEVDSTVFAEAAAGSGKTSHLVDRFVQLVCSGTATIDRLAAITFTEAAAAELRDRVAEGLELVASGTPLRFAECPPSAHERHAAREALLGLDAAAVTTLHGFARRVLSEHPFAAGLPPGFEVLDPVRSAADLDERWPDLVECLVADPERARALQWVLACRASLGGLRTIARRLGENWDLIHAVGARALPRLDRTRILAPLRSALDLRNVCTDDTDLLAAHLDGLSDLARRIEASKDEAALLRLLVTVKTRLSSNLGKKAAWQGRKAEVTGHLADAQREREVLTAEGVHAAMAAVVAGLGEQVLAAADRRRRDGRLEFHDLLVLARDLVRTDAVVRASLHERYRYLLIDEFQDTDPLQAELAFLIAAEPDADVDALPWCNLPTTPGALFFVGDPLQSIYRFRRADISVFLATRDQVLNPPAGCTPGTVARLTTNFRSVPGIVDFVDAVFDQLVGPGSGHDQPAHTPAVAQRSAHGEGRAVTVLGAGTDCSPEWRHSEAVDLASVLASAIDDGWTVGPEGRRLEPSDVTILVPARSALPEILGALDGAGIEYRLESSSLVYGAPEVHEVLAVLGAVDDPSNDVAVIAALRTAAMGCGDDDLVRYRAAGGSWDYRKPQPAALAPDDTVRRAMDALGELHAARPFTPVSALVARVVEGRRMLAAALDTGRWRDEWRRLRFVVDQARQFAETSSGDLRQYLAWVEVQRAEDARVTEVVLPEADVPAVRIMTIHAAKGLEFPLVAVVGLGARPRRVTAPAVLFDVESAPEAALSKQLSTAGYAARCEQEDRKGTFEGLRLLYVALTRAKDHLVVSVHRDAGNWGSLAQFLAGALPEDRSWEASDPGAARVRATRRQPAPVGSFAGPAELEAWETSRRARLDRLPRVLSATAAAKSVAGPVAGVADEGDDTADPSELVVEVVDEADPPARVPWRRGRAGTALGRAVHAVLQMVDLATGEGLEGLARSQAEAEGVGERAPEVARLARSALDSEVVRRAARNRHFRELYVGTPVGNHVLEGFVDLVVDGPDGLEVVDYKTDHIDDEGPGPILPDRYRFQGAAYALAVQAATGRPVVRCTFLFVRAQGPHGAVEVGDLDVAVEDLAVRLGAR